MAFDPIIGRLEYRPDIKYTDKEINSINNLKIEDMFSLDEDIQSIINNLPSDILRRSDVLINNVNAVINSVENILIETPAIPDAYKAAEILEAGNTLGLDLSNGIGYDTYKDLYFDLNKSEYEKQIIIETWEEYHSDINGSIAGEYYTSLLEIQEDIAQFKDFEIRALLKQIHYNSNNASDEYINIEKAFIEQLISLKNGIESIEKQLSTFQIRTMDPMDSENIRMNILESRYEKLNNTYKVSLRKSNVLSEVGNISTYKVNSTNYALGLMDTYLRYLPQNEFEGKLAETLYAIVSGCMDGNTLEKLKQVQLTLRYSFNNQNKHLAEDKQKVESSMSNMVKRILQDVSVRDIGLKVGVMHPVIQILNSLSDDSAQYLEPIADTLLIGINTAEDEYKKNVIQLYGLHHSASDANIRRIKEINQKRKTRDFYKAISAVIAEIESKGKIPDKQSLKGWVNGILKNIGMAYIYDQTSDRVMPLDL